MAERDVAGLVRARAPARCRRCRRCIGSGEVVTQVDRDIRRASVACAIQASSARDRATVTYCARLELRRSPPRRCARRPAPAGVSAPFRAAGWPRACGAWIDPPDRAAARRPRRGAASCIFRLGSSSRRRSSPASARVGLDRVRRRFDERSATRLVRSRELHRLEERDQRSASIAFQARGAVEAEPIERARPARDRRADQPLRHARLLGELDQRLRGASPA